MTLDFVSGCPLDDFGFRVVRGISQLPNLTVVTFRRYLAWHDRWKAGVTDMLPRLLLAHKVQSDSMTSEDH